MSHHNTIHTGIIFAFLLTFTSISSADSQSECDFDKKIYTEMDTLVEELSICYHAISFKQDREFMGAILEEDGTYEVQVQPGAKGHDTVRLRFRRRTNQTLTALWHTHGGKGYARTYFSKTDTDLANQLNVPFYLTDPEGDIRRFDPGAKVMKTGKRIANTKDRVKRGSAAGFLISSIRGLVERDA
jgi:hypothetical protein